MMDLGSPIFTQKQKHPKTHLSKLPSSRSPSSVPFSWEHQPGIPKPIQTRNPLTPLSDPLLPLPPPLRPKPDKPRPDRKKSELYDPFVLAMAECTKSGRHPVVFTDVAERRRRRRGGVGPAWGVGDRSGWMGVFGSCKKVSESAVYVPRSGVFGMLSRWSS